MRTLRILATSLAVTVVTLCGCKKDEPATEHTPREKPVFHLDGSGEAASAPQGDAAPALPPGHPPIGATQPEGSLPPGHEAGNGEAETLKFTAQAGWLPQPARPMTRMVYKLPAEAGDPGDADLSVSTLGGRAVVLTMNIERWCSQFELPAGKTCADFSQPTTIEGTAHPTVLIEMNGAYKGSMAGISASAPKPDHRMLAAVITAPGAQWYVKLVGPEKTVEHWRASFMDFIRQAQ